MTTRLLNTYLYLFTLLLLPSLSWAEAGDASIPQAAIAAPEKAASAPAAATAMAVRLTSPASAPVATIPNSLAKSAPVPAIPVHAALPQAASAPATPLQKPPAKPATPPVNPALTTPSKPNITPAMPAAKQTIAPKPAPITPAKPAPIQPATTPSTNKNTPVAISRLIDIEVFIREGCPQCDKAQEFLTKLKSLQPHLKIVIRDVRKEPAALELLKRVALNQGDIPLDYPAFVVGGHLVIGFTQEASTAQLLLDMLPVNEPINQNTSNYTKDCEIGKDLSCGLIPPAPVSKSESISINVFGHSVPLVHVGLPLLTLTMGLLDGFNHGSTWVLILMISLLAPMKSRPAMLAIAGTFIAVQGIVYYGYLAAWLNLFKFTGTSYVSEIVIASLSIIAGLIYFKNYMFFGQKMSLASQEITNPGIYTHIRKILQSETLTKALLSTTVLAVLVQLGEFSYKSFFPALYTRILTLHQLSSLSNYGYLMLYDLAYMLDDIIILAIAVFTLKLSRSPEKESRLTMLASALLMLGIGLYLILAPH